MSPVLIPLFGVLIPIIAIIGAMFVKPWLAHREKQMELEARMIAEKAA